MNKSIKSIALICLALIPAYLQPCRAQNSPPDSKNSFIVKSDILGEERKAFVYLPKDYEKSGKKYPIVYVLDGEYNFSFAADAVKVLSSWTSRIPQCIVIGITSGNRERDFTTAPDKNWQPPQPIPGAGGADKFLAHLEKELIPYVEKNYRTEPLRIIIGHSLGGLLALHSFTAKPDLFKFYILLDSSLWWNDGAVAKAAMAYLNNNPNYKGKLVWIRDKIPHEVWFGINTEWYDFLQNKRPAGLSFVFSELENETHSSLVFPGTYFGLREIFSDYAFKFEETSDLKAVQDHYKKISEVYGYQVSGAEQVYQNLIGQLSYTKRFKEAVAAGEHWIKEYPNSFLAYQTLGKAYLDSGNRESAATYLKRALELNPDNENTKQMLRELN